MILGPHSALIKRGFLAGALIGLSLLAAHAALTAEPDLAFIPFVVGALLVGGAIAGGTLATVLTIAAVALSTYQSLREAHKLKLGDRVNQVGLTNVVETDRGLPVVYGRAKLGALLADVVNGANLNWLIVPIAICHGSRVRYVSDTIFFQLGIAEITRVLYDDREGAVADPSTVYKLVQHEDFDADTWFTTDGVNTLPFPPFAGADNLYFPGTHDQDFAAAMTYYAGDSLIAYSADDLTWDSADKGQGIAGLIWVARWNPELWFRGLPVFTFEVKGNFVEDTRSEISGESVSFNGTTDVISKAGADWDTYGYLVDDFIEVVDSTSNDGAYRITALSGTDLTVETGDLTTEGSSSVETLKRWAYPTDNGGDNPAMCIRDYLISDTYGPGFDETEIDNVSFETAADYCDELVPGIVGNDKRFKCHGWIETGQPIEDNLRELLSSCRGNLVWEGGKFKLFITNPNQSPVLDLNESNIVGDWNFQLGGIEEKYNVGVARYVNPAQNYKMTQQEWPHPSLTNSMLADDDGFENQIDLDLPFTPSELAIVRARPQHIVQTLVKESRQAISCSVRCKQEVIEQSVGDLVTVTHETPGWSGKSFWLWGMQLNPDSTVNVTLREYDSTTYDYTDVIQPDDEPDTNLPSPRTVVPPSNVNLSSGTSEDRVRVTWTASADDPFVDYYDVQVRHNTSTGGDGQWRTTGRVPSAADPLEAFVASVRNGQSWRARVRAVNSLDVTSLWVESNDHTVEIHDIPSVQLTLVSVSEGVELEITNYDLDADGIDAAYVLLYARENDSSSGPNPIEGPQYLVGTVEPGPGSGPVLVPALEYQYIRAFAVPYNVFGGRGTATAVQEAMSGTAGVGPSGPPTSLSSPTTGAVSLTYNENSPSDDTITRSSGSFVTDGFVAGMQVTVNGTSSNDGVYTLQTVAALTLTLDPADDLADEGPVSSTVQAQEPEAIEVEWSYGDVAAQTRVYVNGATYSTEAGAVVRKRIEIGLESDTSYVIGLRHLLNGIFDPLETADAVEITQSTVKGTLGVPQNFQATTIDPHRVKLTWAIGTDGDAASYMIERSDTGVFGGEEEPVTSPGVGVTEYTHSDPDEADYAWYFRIKAERTKWNESPWTSVLGTYGTSPQLTSASFSITAGTETGGACDVLPGCTQAGSRHLIRWYHIGGDDSLHHIEIWRSINGGAYAKASDNLSVDETDECGAKVKADGSYAYFYALEGDDPGSNIYQYKVQLRADSGDTLLNEIETGSVTELGSSCTV